MNYAFGGGPVGLPYELTHGALPVLSLSHIIRTHAATGTHGWIAAASGKKERPRMGA